MSCTIIIFHFESLVYLEAVIRQIRKYRRDDIYQHIIIAEQGGLPECAFAKDEDVTVVRMPRYGSGYSVDYIMRNISIETDFVCTIDVDTIPIHRNWLYVPIRLVEELNLSFAGVHAEIEEAYKHMGQFFCMCQHFRVGRTETYKRLALMGGFVKNDFRNKLPYANNRWNTWSDDAVAAHWWEDTYENNNKLTFAITNYLGIAPKEGRYGRYTDDLILHFGFSYNWKMVGNKKESMGNEFIAWMHRMETEGLNDDMIAEILANIKPLEAPIPRLYWDGVTKTAHRTDEKTNLLIEKLKSE